MLTKKAHAILEDRMGFYRGNIPYGQPVAIFASLLNNDDKRKLRL